MKPSHPDAVLSDITHLLLSERSPEKVLEAVADALEGLVPHDSLILFRAEVPLQVLRPALVRDPVYAEEILAMEPQPFGEGITGVAVTAGQPVLCNDAHLDPRVRQVPGTPVEPESIIAIPLLAGHELKGALCISRLGEGNHFTGEEFGVAIRFGDLAALAIDNAQIRAQLETEVITDHLTALHNHRFFHERLGQEVRRSNRRRTSVGLLIYDIDDFKRVNDTYGHMTGDEVLQSVASISRETCRQEDVVFRIGGEEFAVILPGASVEETAALAERLRDGIGRFAYTIGERITVSVGVTASPLHAASPRELIACADLALLGAKADGKNRVTVYDPATLVFGSHRVRRGANGGPARSQAGTGRAVGGSSTSSNGSGKRSAPDGQKDTPRPSPDGAGSEGSATDGPRGDGNRGRGSNGAQGRLASMAMRGERRSVAQLQMLHTLSSKLNRFHDVTEIAEAITAELRSLIDYHNCRVHLLDANGMTLIPIAFRGDLSEYQGETFEALITEVGVGVTGHVAETAETLYTPNANECEYAVTIPGTYDVEESMLAVAMRYGARVIGTIVLSKLGVDQFDDEDIRLLEVLAANAAVAFENARLMQMEREAAETSVALLAFSQALTKVRNVEEILQEAMAAIPALLTYTNLGVWIRDAQSGAFRLAKVQGFAAERVRAADPVIPAEVAERFLLSVDKPFVLTKEVASTVPPEYRVSDPREAREVLVAPMRWEPDGLATFAIVAPEEASKFSSRDLRLARGIADITSLALGNASRFDQLEQAYVSTVEALANAVEAKDEYTGDHCRALAEMSLTVGAVLGLSGQRLKMLELGALFHDIGKIGVASDIIRKPGPLTASERREMNEHPAIGEQILAPVPFLQPVRPIIRASHERWDGGGYPDRLRQEEIPLESRIVFVCDAYHAMTTDRPYRSALPEKEAIRRLKLSAGTQFDPGVVEAFVRLHSEGEIHFH